MDVCGFGNCSRVYSGYKCSCPEPYTGETCEFGLHIRK